MRKKILAALLFTGILAITSIALADQPTWAGNGKNNNKHQQNDSYQNQNNNNQHSADNGKKGNKHEKNDSHQKQKADDGNRNQSNVKHNQYSDSQNKNGHDGKRNSHFNEHNRTVINNYYTEQYQHGHCPPGLVKRNNSCRPSNHSRNWQVGRQLPREVIFYDVPQQVTVLLGPPPSHHRYVRVAGDILLITIGTGMVVDAIQDLNNM